MVSASERGWDRRGILAEFVVDLFDGFVRGESDNGGAGLDGESVNECVDHGHVGGVAWVVPSNVGVLQVCCLLARGVV